MTDEEARDAVAAYTGAKESTEEPEKAKRAALDTLKAWMRRRGDAKATINGRTVSLVTSKRYNVNYRKLNAMLDPETRAEDRDGERVGVRASQLDALPAGAQYGERPF